MKKYLFIFILGIVAGSGGYWAFRDGPMAAKLREQPTLAKVTDTITGKIQEHAATEVKDEMTRQGQVVSTKPANSVVTIEDGLLKDLIKAKIAADPFMAKSDISVSIDHGEVKLSGIALSYEQVSRAIRLAMECDATSKVISTIKV